MGCPQCNSTKYSREDNGELVCMNCGCVVEEENVLVHVPSKSAVGTKVSHVKVSCATFGSVNGKIMELINENDWNRRALL